MDSDNLASAIASAKASIKIPEDISAKEDAENKEANKKEDKEDGSNGNNDAESTPPAKKAATEEDDVSRETVDIKVIFNKKKHDVTFPLDDTVGQLKAHLMPIIEIPTSMMKVMIKGLAKDDRTLRQLNVTKNTKVMVVGSSVQDVLTVSSKPKPEQERKEREKAKSKELYLSNEKQHKKVLDKGKPEDAMPGKKGVEERLPPLTPLSGMLNKAGGKVRLTFKMELDQLWIGTKERTEKVGMTSIKSIVSEPIENHEEYHMLAFQLGPTEASRYWVYWVPAQYVEAIKEAILGKWGKLM